MNFKEKLQITLRGYKTIQELVPGLILSVVVNAVFSSILPFINIFMSSIIITAISNSTDMKHVLFLAILTALLNVIVTLIAAGFQKLTDYYGAKFWNVEDKPLKDKIQTMDYELVENADIHLRIERLRTYRNTMGYGLPRLFFNGEVFIQNVFKVIFSVSLLATVFTTYHSKPAGSFEFLFSPIAIILLILVIAVNICANIFFSRNTVNSMTKIFSRFESANRMGNYYMNYLLNYKAGKDLKLYALNGPILKEFGGVKSLFVDVTSRWQRILAKNNSLLEILNTVTTGIIYIFVSLKALFGSFGIGNIVQYVGSLVQLNAGVSGTMSALSSLDANTKILKLFFEFIDLPDKKYHGTLPIEKRSDNEYELEFRNVSFKYPATEKYVLKNLNLKLNIGKRLAVVGMNGSGKTTMIKLLCRLYDPTEGEITLNGIDIKKYDYTEYMNVFSVVFQDFKLFSFSLGQNVAASVEVDSDKATDCLNKAGLAERMSTMPKGINTPLYKDFDEDGVEISGGEAQKIALARALYKDAPFIILDEPTAALDPIAEYEIYSKFNKIVGEKTAIFISHRLSSCRFCDDIAVFHEGELIQRGSHDTLIADEYGKYYELWNAQAQYYA